MDRLTERLGQARKALDSFRPFAKLKSPTVEQRDVAMIRFLYTFETTWKAAQRYLQAEEGREEGSPKACIRVCRETGLLTDEDAESALNMSDDRNLMSHTYDEPLAREIFKRLAGYADLAERWLTAIAVRVRPKSPPRGRSASRRGKRKKPA